MSSAGPDLQPGECLLLSKPRHFQACGFKRRLSSVSQFVYAVRVWSEEVEIACRALDHPIDDKCCPAGEGEPGRLWELRHDATNPGSAGR